MDKIFDKYNLLITEVDEKDLLSFLIKMDIDDNGNPTFPLDLLSEEIMNVIPEYVFAEYQGTEITKQNAMNLLRTSAKSIYKIKEFDLMRRVYLENDEAAKKELETAPYKNRGEFGELLLHFLLRDFRNTIPLISKVYFKDAAGVPAHGFDAVHISVDEGILWLGESKLYTDGKLGINALVQDLNEHLKTDYLNDQFTLIAKNIYNNSIPHRDEWIKKLTESGTLSDKLKFINIPMLCVYEHDVYSKFSDMTLKDAVDYHITNVRNLKAHFDHIRTNPLCNRCNIILFLLPIKSKTDLVRRLHERLWHVQSM